MKTRGHLALPVAVALLAAVGACTPASDQSGRSEGARGFPEAYRPVSTLAGDEFTNEDQRDDMGEAAVVMDLAAINPGTTVADIGAGEGYYTIRLADRVGPKGRVLAEDIDPGSIQRLGQRVERERLGQVSIRTGKPENPMLPGGSFDRIFMVHMYHEIAEPYAFLWHMRPALRPGGQVIVVDVDRPSDQHGMPPRQLFCEFGAVGFRLVQFVLRPELNGYYAAFEASGERPRPEDIKPCNSVNGKTGTQ
ncbi:class I SAM-dependent methyltransferase [Novosphingobium sp.]|uniref:class I SAM-dependent methyltransferase n=1 Tax=Novosphingobium sp. TaxID=1874826 RepID=UPI0037046331